MSHGIQTRTTHRRITTRTTIAEIVDALYQDGFEDLVERAVELKRAARAGCLLWTAARVTTTDASHIDRHKGALKAVLQGDKK